MGADWEVAELRTVASKLLGTVEAIREPEDLAADFAATMERAMGRRTSNVSLRVWTPVGARVTLMQQVFPTIEDLTDRRAGVGELEGDYPTGAWGDETRHYHVSIEVPARDVGDEMLAGRVKLLVDDVAVSEAKVRAIWTEDDAKSTRISPELAHYTGQEELSRRDRRSVRRSAVPATRTPRPRSSGTRCGSRASTATLTSSSALAAMVEIVEASTGTVRPKVDVDELDRLALEAGSVKTNRLG